MRGHASAWPFGPEHTAQQGVRYDLELDAYREALPAWRYPDLAYIVRESRRTRDARRRLVPAQPPRRTLGHRASA